MAIRPENSNPAPAENPSGIRDNYSRGNVADFLTSQIDENTELSVVSAYFTIYAFDALKEHLTRIRSLRFLFGEPRFVQAVDPERDQPMAFIIRDDAIALAHALEQKRVAAECAAWLQEKADIRSVVRSGFLLCDIHGKACLRRLQELEADLDALVARLYGLTRDEYRLVLEQTSAPDDFRSACLEAFGRLETTDACEE